MVELIGDYVDDKVTAINFIRTLSGAFNPSHAVSILALICAICRVEEGDLDKETFRSLFIKGAH